MKINNIILNLDNIEINIYLLRTFFISICTYYIFLRITNQKKYLNLQLLAMGIYFFLISTIVTCIKYNTNSFISTIILIFLITCICSKVTKNSIENSITITIISLSINYILFFISIIVIFLLNIIFFIKNDYLNLLLMIIVHISLLKIILKFKRFKYGILFLQKNSKDDFFNILVLNIGTSLSILFIMFSNRELLLSRSLFFAFIIFSIIMFITIQKSLQLYYKQKLLEQNLTETKEELEKKKEEIKQLEAENLNFSKTSHSLAHKQRSLEYKLEQLKQKYEIAEEIEIENRIKDISKELYNKTPEIELSKTGITEIDDMLKYMQSECIKNKIEFQLQIRGNIHEMVNNYISKEDLSILIADHVKNAIIAINYSENINKSILVRLGKINKIYSLYIYDSGIEFEKETLSNLGKKPSTTHADNGGTGMGFMNTFDTLKKYSASLIINEYNKPSKDNYTKSIIIKFDKNKEFKINSYRA